MNNPWKSDAGFSMLSQWEMRHFSRVGCEWFRWGENGLVTGLSLFTGLLKLGGVLKSVLSDHLETIGSFDW